MVADAPPGDVAYRVAASIARAGPRPAASVRERRAQLRLRERFADAGLTVRVQRFATPRGPSRNVIGVWDGSGTCVRVLMAHADTVPPSPGAEDNASGLGLLAGLAPRLRVLPNRLRRRAQVAPRCDVWLVATGAEERIHTGSPDHLGALALARIVPRRRLRYALSLDEVGRGSTFRLRSPVAAPRRRVEGELLAAARRARVAVDWQRDDGTGNSDHREFELAGLPGVKLGGRENACRHSACDTFDRLEPRAFARVQRVVEDVLSR